MSVSSILTANVGAAANQPGPCRPPIPSGVAREGEGIKLLTVAAGRREAEDIKDGEQVITSGLPLAERVRKIVEAKMSRDFSQMFLWELSRVLTLDRMLRTHSVMTLMRPEHSGMAPKPYFSTSSTLKTGLF